MNKIDQKKTDIWEAIKKIDTYGTDEIFKLAASAKDGLDIIIFYNPINESFIKRTWLPGTCLPTGSRLIEVYHGNNAHQEGTIIGKLKKNLEELFQTSHQQYLQED